MARSCADKVVGLERCPTLYCSVARTWSVVGERRTMMVLSECFRGERRYDHFRSKLGLGSNVLNDRLPVLLDEGVLDRVRYQDHPTPAAHRRVLA